MSAAKLTQPPDAAAFCTEAKPLLLADEVRLGWILGIAESFALEPPQGDRLPWFGVLHRGGIPHVAALLSPPGALLLTDATKAELVPIVDALRARGQPLSGVRAPDATARRFGLLWCRAADVELVPHFAQALHHLDRVAYEPDVPGRLRQGATEELEVLMRWTSAFAAEARIPNALPTHAERLPALDQGRLYVWDDGGPVSMAVWSRPTRNGASIGWVYTPPDLRGRGYASALVAALSQLLLDGGKRFCCLFTDLANPVSNRIYARLGYRRVADFRYDRFSS